MLRWVLLEAIIEGQVTQVRYNRFFVGFFLSSPVEYVVDWLFSGFTLCGERHGEQSTYSGCGTQCR